MLDRLRDRLEGVLDALEAERYHAAEGAGGAAPEAGGVYRASAELLRLDRISEVQLVLAGASGEEERSVRMLLEWLAHARAACEAADELDRHRDWRARAQVVAGERRFPVRTLAWVAAGVAAPEARHALYEGYLEALTEHDDVLEGPLGRRREALEELGYGSRLATEEVLSGIDVRGLAREADRFVADTDAVYRELLDWHLPRLAGVEAADAREVDGLRLERAAAYDSVFAGRNLAAGIMGALADSGVDPAAGGRLRLRTRAERPLGPGAAAYALRVPQEVVLVVSPHAGRPVHAAVLSALGQALHAAYTDPSLPLEYRRMGDGSVPLAFGLLLQGLLESPAFLARHYGLPQPRVSELLRLAALLLLLRTRRDAALLRYEVEMLGDGGGEDRGRYAELLSGATGLRHDPRGMLDAVGPALASVRRLRAEQLRITLGEQLRDRYDEDWHRNPRSGAALVDWMAPGRSYSAAELGVQVSSTAPGMERVGAHLRGLLA